MESYKVKVRKLFKGFVSIRDYVVQTCIRKNQKLVVEYESQKMTLSVEDLKNKFQIHKRVFQSEYSKKYNTYQLLDFKFIVDGKTKSLSLMELL
jgi:hypothetical protein